MKESTSREKILKQVRRGLAHKSPPPKTADFSSQPGVFPEFADSLDLEFAKRFRALDGVFFYCENEENFQAQLAELALKEDWKAFLVRESEIKTVIDPLGLECVERIENLAEDVPGITGCEGLVARTGSIVVSSRNGGRSLSVWPETHIVVAYTSQIFAEIRDALEVIRDRYSGKLPSMLSFISGPSRTADIEKTLVKGAHGPRRLCLFLIEDL